MIVEIGRKGVAEEGTAGQAGSGTQVQHMSVVKTPSRSLKCTQEVAEAEMQQLVDDIGDALRSIDCSGVPFKNFKPGVGPYGEPQMTKLVAQHLANIRDRYPGAKTCRIPDLLVPGLWALEFKIVRPFGDNGIEAEHWSQNLLHPYPGNVSAISDVYKLVGREGPERRGVIVVTYEHEPPQIDVATLVSAFELLCRELLKLPLGERHVRVVDNCVHPIHRRATVYGWPLVDLLEAMEDRVELELATKALKEKGRIPWERAKKELGL